MSIESQFLRITQRWKRLADAGQQICIEELCEEEGESCSPELRERLKAFAESQLAPKTILLKECFAPMEEF